MVDWTEPQRKVSSRFFFCWDQWSHKWYPYIKINKILSLPFASLERTFTNILHSRDILQEDDEHCHITCHGILKQFTIELEKKENQNVCSQKKHLQEIGKISSKTLQWTNYSKDDTIFIFFLQWSRVYLCIYFLISSFT